ncbi:MAG: IS1 family transposase [Cyanobacteria bacterium SID2]|nr:IS1 family transposase [Cyanobacteria bacterium SID2]MBP0004713.1 IS1 family transposase [Cyanobacteria bacterium SBC]
MSTFDSRPTCSSCGSEHIVKNGSTHHKKPKFKGKDCGRQFVEFLTKKYILDEIKALIGRLLLEKIPLAGIARVTKVSRSWLQDYVNHKNQHIPCRLKVIRNPIPKGDFCSFA